MKSGLISCVFPTIRGGSLVFQRLKELNECDYENLEVILIEDGPVPTYQIPENFKYELKIIKLPENSGSVSIPRAIGISYSQGEFISHVDDDVVIFSNKYKVLSKGISNSSLCYGNRIEIYLPKTPKNNTDKIIEIIPNKITNWKPLIGWGVDGGQYMYRSEVWKNRHYIFPKRGCDWETAKEICFWDDNITYVDDTVCGYIWHNNNRSLDDNTKVKQIYPHKFHKFFNVNSRFLGFKTI